MTATGPTDVAAGTGRPGSFTGYAWQRLATESNSGRLSAIRKLSYLAVAYHADRTSRTGGGYAGSTVADLATWTGLPHAALIPALAVLQAGGWVDGDDTGRYRPTGDAHAGTCGEPIAGSPPVV